MRGEQPKCGVQTKMSEAQNGKMSGQTFGILTVLQVYNYRTCDGYVIIITNSFSVFRKLLGDFIPNPLLGLCLWATGDFPGSLFCRVPKILKLYYDVFIFF